METLQPKLRFPNYINNYNNILFNEVVESYGYGPRFNANDYSENGNVKTIRGTDISLEGEIKYIQVPTALLDDNTVNTHKLLDGDLVMITTADCGLTGVFRKQNIDFIPSAYAVRIRLKDNTNSFYFKYFFQTKLAKNQVDKFIRKATVANLPGSDILKFNINLPNFEEQTKIASFLSAVDEKLNLLKEKKTLLEQYKIGIVQKIFSQEIRFKDDNGNDFEEWEKNIFSNYIKLYRGSSPRPIVKYITDSENGVNWIKIGDTKGIENFIIESVSEKITIEGAKNSRNVNIGEIILANSMSFGKSYILNIEGCIYDGWFVLREYEKFFDKMFLIQLLNSDFLQKQYKTLSTGGVVQNINSDIVYSTFLLKPSLSEQSKIAKFLSAIDEKLQFVTNQIQNTQEYKEGLLKQMFV